MLRSNFYIASISTGIWIIAHIAALWAHAGGIGGTFLVAITFGFALVSAILALLELVFLSAATDTKEQKEAPPSIRYSVQRPRATDTTP